MGDLSNSRGPILRAKWLWLGGGVLVTVLLVAVILIVPRVFQKGPCDTALPFASELGLQLCSSDEVIACEWHSSFPDSGGKVMVRTASPATREALLRRSGVSEEVAGRAVSVDDGPFREERWRPNLERSEQVYLSTAPNGNLLKIIYDEGVESGLLLKVLVSQM